jgi:hypothetical protein
MPKYSKILPKLTYNGVSITDITHRLDMLKTVEKYATMYYSVTIDETATPEKVAEQYYGSQDYWWIVCAINKVIDPFYDWVMRETEVYAYVDKIYDDQDEIHHYEDAEFIQYPTNNVEEDRVPVTNIEWEIHLNDKLRHIMLLKPSYVPMIADEFAKWMRNTKQQIQE